MDPQNIRNLKDLSQRLNVSVDFLESLKDESIRMSYIKQYSLPKRTKPYRRVVYSTESLPYHLTLKALSEFFSSKYTVPNEVHGFVAGRSIVTNAKQHLGKKYLLNIDLEDFFGSVATTHVSEIIASLGFNHGISDYLSMICTINGTLVQGFSTSPVLSNMALAELDRSMKHYASKQSLIYTRYADDLSFSSDEHAPDLTQLTEIVNRFSFKVNSRKVKHQWRGSHQYVTGLTIFDSQQPRIPKKYKRNLRLEIYNLGKSLEPIEPEFRLGIDNDQTRRIKGKINYVMSVEPEYAFKLYEQLDKVLKPLGFDELLMLLKEKYRKNIED